MDGVFCFCAVLFVVLTYVSFTPRKNRGKLRLTLWEHSGGVLITL